MTEDLEELKNEHAVDKTSWETLRVQMIPLPTAPRETEPSTNRHE